MKRDLYWFTTCEGECAALDFYGTYEQAEKYAEKSAKIIGEEVYINLGEDLVGVVFA